MNCFVKIPNCPIGSNPVWMRGDLVLECQCASDQNGLASNRLAHLDILPLIPHHHSSVGPNAPFFASPPNQTGFRFPATAPIARCVGAIIDRMDMATRSTDGLQHPTGDLFQRRGGHPSASYTGLVGDYHHLHSIALQLPQSRQYTRKELELFPTGDVTLLKRSRNVQHPIAVQEDGFNAMWHAL